MTPKALGWTFLVSAAAVAVLGRLVGRRLGKQELGARTSRLRSHVLRRGSVLYHGTSAAEPFEEDGSAPDVPAWFSTSRSVAQHFVNWHGAGPRPRVLEYRLTSSIPRLATITSGDEMRKLAEAAGEDEREGPIEVAQAVCDRTSYNGWYSPNNYPDGDDIMLCATDSLEFVGGTAG